MGFWERIRGKAARPPAPALLLVPHPRGWALRPEGQETAAFVFRTKVAALERGMLLAARKGSRLIVHDDEGNPE
jgi:hypothetical protein